MNSIMTKFYVYSLLRIERLREDQRGVTAIEYALIGVAMATLLAAVLGDQNSGFLGALNKTFVNISNAITSVTSASTKSS